MIVVGMFVTWAGYATGLYGYCLMRGYQVTFKQMIIPSEWPGWSTITTPATAGSSTSSSSGDLPGSTGSTSGNDAAAKKRRQEGKAPGRIGRGGK